MQKITIAAPLMGTDLFRKYMMSKYVQSIARAGGNIRWIAIEDPQNAAEEAAACDGLLLPGGADINPALYGQQKSEACGTQNPERDAAEPLMLREFLHNGKPILCICRGLQMLNVHMGGTLRQDIRAEQQYKHADFLSRTKSTHPVSLQKDSRLYAIFAAEELCVNSIHHQAIDTLGKGLSIAAESPDGFIEAVENPNHPFCIGVQWHPEHMSKKSEMQRKLFTAYIHACKTGNTIRNSECEIRD